MINFFRDFPKMQHFSENWTKLNFLFKNLSKSLKILRIFAKFLLNFSPTTDRAPTTFRLLSTTGREACRLDEKVSRIIWSDSFQFARLNDIVRSEQCVFQLNIIILVMPFSSCNQQNSHTSFCCILLCSQHDSMSGSNWRGMLQSELERSTCNRLLQILLRLAIIGKHSGDFA